MNRRLLVTLGLFLITGAIAQDASSTDPAPPSEQEHPPIPANWPGVEYAEVRIYLYNPGPRHEEKLIIDKGKLHPEVFNPDGIKLDATQTERLLTLLRHESPDEGVPSCKFLPHHGIVFYDREGKPVAHVSVCFLCEIEIADPANHRMSESDFAALKHLVQDLGLPVFKTSTEADVHFAKQWSDTKLKAAIDKYLFDESELSAIDDDSRGEQLRGLRERTHPFLLNHLAAEKLRSDWLKKAPNKNRQGTPFSRLCGIFGDTTPTAVIPLLAPFLDEADTSARCSAAATIAETGTPGIVPFVRRSLKDLANDTSADIIPPPPDQLRNEVADYRTTVSSFTLWGLQKAIDRGVLDPETKALLFPDVQALSPAIGIGHLKEWAKVLIGLDPNKALELLLSDEYFKVNSPKLSSFLETAVEVNLQVPREHLLKLVAELKSAGLDPDHQRWLLGPALVLLGQHHHPDDLELFQNMSDSDLAHHGMPGLLAWHGLHDYRMRLSMQIYEKGSDSLNENQRIYFATSEFTTRGPYYFWYPIGGHWREALAGLKAMKRDQLAATLEEIAAKFGPDGPSADLETRKTQFDTLQKKGVFKDFTGFEEGTMEAADPKDLSLDRFAIEHAESFK
ncbi:MAG TPA: DUF4375 domain-containing protein [Haloferula sp.]